MRRLKYKNFKEWMDQYATASKTKDARAVSELFAPDCKYCEKPFDEPIVGQEGIYKYWDSTAQGFKDIQFSYEILAVEEQRGIALWRATFVSLPSGSYGALDGVLVADFNDEGKCCHFREWWHYKDFGGLARDPSLPDSLLPDR